MSKIFISFEIFYYVKNLKSMFLVEALIFREVENVEEKLLKKSWEIFQILNTLKNLQTYKQK